MKGIAGFICFATLGGVLAFAPPQARAGWRPDTVNCYSDGGRRSYCPVPWREARLARQDSRAPCVRGQSWGLGRDGIWVDEGCRGIFEDASGYDDHAYRGERYHRDDRDDRERRYDDRTRWASEPYPRPGYVQPPIRPARPAVASRGGDGRVVSCDSNDKKRVFCRWPIGQGARLVEQTSRNDCVEGHSYGFTPEGIWASKGCRGKFNIGY